MDAIKTTFRDEESRIEVYASQSAVVLYSVDSSDGEEVALLVTPEMAEEIRAALADAITNARASEDRTRAALLARAEEVERG